MCGKGSNTTTQTQTSSPNPAMTGIYNALLQRGQSIAGQNYQPYGGQLVAPMNDQQMMGIGGINANANFASPYITQAADYMRRGAAPISAEDIQRYQNPYTQNVVDATQRQFTNANAEQQQQITGNAAAQGALGGDRVSVAKAEGARQQKMAQDPVIAGLYSHGFDTALGAAERQQQNWSQAGFGLGNLGISGQNAALQGAGAQLGAGGLMQQNQQALNQANYGQYMQQLAYPYQQAGWLAQLAGGIGSQYGGTTTGSTTKPPPNAMAQYGGLGIAGLGALGQSGAFGGAGWLSSMLPMMALSDERAKEGMEEVGRLHDGQPVFRFNYKGDPKTQIGLGAQHVEQTHPEAVKSLNGVKYVDYAEATDDAARPHKADGGGLGGSFAGSFGGMPYGGAPSFVPSLEMARGAGLPKLPGLPQQPQSGAQTMLTDAIKMAGQMNSGKTGESIPGYFGGSPETNPTALAPIGAATDDMAYGGAVEPGIALRGYDDGGTVIPREELDERFSGRPYMPPTSMVAFPAIEGRKPDISIENLLGRSHGRPGGPATDSPEPPLEAPLARGIALRPPARTITLPRPEPTTEGLGGLRGDDVPPVRDRGGIDLPRAAGGDRPAEVTDEQGVSTQTSPWLSLMHAGLGMMASKSPFLGTAVGEGGLAGLQNYTQQQGVERAEKARQDQLALQTRNADLAAKRLAQDADLAQQRIGLQTQTLAETRRQHDVSMMQPRLMGTDEFGRSVYGIPDPKTGTLRPIDTKTGALRDPGAAEPSAPVVPTVAGKPEIEAKDNPITSFARSDINERVHPEVLATLDPAIANQVRALAEGRMAFPTGNAARTPYWQRMVSLVSQYDPEFDAINYGSRYQALKDLTSGVTSKNITALNTVMGHIGKLDEAGKALDNFHSSDYLPTSKPLNWALGHYRDYKQDPRLIAFDETANAVANELEKAFRGNTTAIAGIKEWRKDMHHGMSPEQIEKSNKTLVGLLGERIDAVSDQYNRAFRSTREAPDFMSPKAREVMDRLLGRVPAGPTTGGGTVLDAAKSVAPAAPAGSAPVRVGTPAEAQKLDPGTHYMGPDGVERIR